MPAEHHQTILDAVDPRNNARRFRLPDRLLLALGVTLLASTITAIVAGPSIMSRPVFTGVTLVAVLLYTAYAIYVNAHSRSKHVSMERAYSAHLEELSQRLRTMAYRDSLTGLYNHRYFYEQLSHEVERSVRYGQPLAVLLMDMDNFKQINDAYGHLVGDKCLGLVGQAIARQIRGSDIGARYGGDEFVVILPNTALDEARSTCKKLADAVAQTAAISPNEKVKLGISAGIAVCPDDSRAPGELLQIADRRLYDDKAKRKPASRKRTNVA